jgi:hypothetical protein
MAVPPPPLKKIVPSLQIKDGETATFSLADLKAQLPSLSIEIPSGKDPIDGTMKLSIGDLRKILRVALAGVKVDEKWYLTQVPLLAEDIRKRKFSSAAEHYYAHGYMEGRVPEKPQIDEKYYLQTNADVAAAVKSGKVKGALEHYLQNGYAEGRNLTPPEKETQRMKK